MYRAFLSITASVCLTLIIALPAAGGDNELTDQEKAEGFILLFNGKDLQGWHRPTNGFGGWHVDDSALALSKGGGMIYANEKFGNFVLKIDFKMSKGCNSGVFIRVGDERDEVQTGMEIQVQDDYGKKPNRHSCGSIYDLVAPSKIAVKPVGDWNSYVITAKDNNITVELNGEMVSAIDVDKWDTAGKQPDGSKNKYKMAVKDFPRTGLIGLQDHGRPVWFKNIKVKPLK